MAVNPGPDGDRPEAEPVAEIEAALVSIRRAQTGRALARLSRRRDQREGRHAGLPDAVFELLDAVAGAAERDQRPTVTEAAALLGVDQPRASRLATQALEAGLLRRQADQRDGRRSRLALTAEGHDALAHIRAFRQGVIAEATATWTPGDRAALARLLTRFVHDMSGVSGVSNRLPVDGPGRDRPG